ncbi:MAG: hypothetical protein LBO69_06280 [Ignavibacteria bacterium]|jgi:uncharacterized protein YfaP (DUF2135 family)|nr:hypothetical protein [Ignavibacteria bacterium]
MKITPTTTALALIAIAAILVLNGCSNNSNGGKNYYYFFEWEQHKVYPDIPRPKSQIDWNVMYKIPNSDSVNGFYVMLTWRNNDREITDLDLHLVGPNGMHIYFGDKINSDESMGLARDLIDEKGRLTEVIYSVKGKEMPKGEYYICVNGYSGYVPKEFNVRIIHNGEVANTIFEVMTKTNGSYDLDDDASIIPIEKFIVE